MVWITGNDTVKYSNYLLSVEIQLISYANNFSYNWNNNTNLDTLILKNGDDLFLHSNKFGSNNYDWNVNAEGIYDNIEWTGGRSGGLDISIYNVQSDVKIWISATFK